MALIPFPKCGHQISEQAKECPKCEHQLATEKPAAPPNQTRPPIIPVVLGVFCLFHGLIFGWIYAIWTIALVNEPDWGTSSQLVQLLGLLASLTVVQIPAGVGLLLHQRWAYTTCRLTTLCVFFIAPIGHLVAASYFLTPDPIKIAFSFGIVVSLPWAIALRFLLGRPKMRQLFTGITADTKPTGAV